MDLDFIMKQLYYEILRLNCNIFEINSTLTYWIKPDFSPFLPHLLKPAYRVILHNFGNKKVIFFKIFTPFLISPFAFA